MSRLVEFPRASIAFLSAAVFLTGCGAVVSMPSVEATPAQVWLGSIQGNNYGGHAPLVGSRIFVLQAGSSGYGAKVTSLLSSGETTTGYYGNTFTTALDSVTNSPTNGFYYITSDSRGAFYISGDYTCTAGDPVYIYASGGNATTTAPVSITGATGTDDAGGNLLITFSTTGNQLLYQGESVTFGTFNPATTAYQGFAGTTQVVSPLNLTTSTFAVELGASSSTIANASFTSTATQASVVSNPAIVNLALLGNCPSPFTITGVPVGTSSSVLQGISASDIAKLHVGEQIYGPGINNTTIVSIGTTSVTMSGADTGGNASTSYSYTVTPLVLNFGSSSSQSINFIYMNEVSTVAAAYALAGFSAVGSSQNDAVHFGSSSTNLLGFQNAANNAGNLYDIQGSVQGTGGDGDTHIARVTTPAGNGTVPQTMLNTVANILANCEDSANTYNAATATGGTASTQCSTLFANATSDGTTSGTKPSDTATAAINIAPHPSGAPSYASFVSNLYNAQTGNAPFQPSLGTKPNDFAVGIQYTGSEFVLPDECAGDSQGNEWCSDYSTNLLTKLSPLGVVLYSLSVPSGPTHTMVDTSSNIWVTSQNGNMVYEFTSAGVAVTGSPYNDSSAITTPAGISNDGNDHTFLNDYGNNNIIEITGSGASPTYTTYTSTCLTNSTTNSLDAAGYFWTSGGNSNQACRISTTGTLKATITGLSTPSSVDIDSSGRAWIPNNGNNTLAQITPTTTTPFYTLATFSGGGMSGPSGVAVDGLGNVWMGNKTAYSASIFSVSEFTNAGVAVTGTGGYQSGGIKNPIYLSLDISGDVWFSNYAGASVEELIGAAAPTVRPKAAAVYNSTIATRP